jgi:hypothetical protein
MTGTDIAKKADRGTVRRGGTAAARRLGGRAGWLAATHRYGQRRAYEQHGYEHQETLGRRHRTARETRRARQLGPRGSARGGRVGCSARGFLGLGEGWEGVKEL